MRKHINPAILVQTFAEYEKEIDILLQVTDEFDVDLIDWARSPLKTLKAIEAIDLNRFAKLNFDIMMDDPRDTADLLIKSKVPNRIIVNLESDYEVEPIIKSIKKAGIEAGISLNPENTAEQAIPFLPYIDFVQIMTIAPGAQGNPFLSARLAISIELRDLGYDGLIGIDGGVTELTIPIIKKFPIDVLSVGSSFSHVIDPSKAYKDLVELFTSPIKD